MIFTVLARQVLVQSLPSSRARSKRMMNQTMFDVPDPLVVQRCSSHMSLSMILLASFILGSLSMTVRASFFIKLMCPNTQMMISPL